MYTGEDTINPHIDRQMGAHSFTTTNPTAFITWLEHLDYHHLPPVRRNEVGRLEHGGWTASIFASGLVVVMPEARR